MHAALPTQKIELATSSSTRVHKAVYILGVLGLAVQYVIVLARPAKYQWDFRTYFYAAQLLIEGRDPYDLGALMRLSAAYGVHDSNVHPFIYPVHALLWFLPLSELGYHAAYYSYLALKLGVIIAFLVIVRTWIKDRWWRALTPLLALLFFGGAIPSDLRTGNVALFEATLVLTGFVLLQRGASRTILFVYCAGKFLQGSAGTTRGCPACAARHEEMVDHHTCGVRPAILPCDLMAFCS